MSANISITNQPISITVIDLASQLQPGCFSPGRAGLGVKTLVLHDTYGTSANPDSNSLPLDYAGFRAREQATINWFLSGGAASIHYMDECRAAIAVPPPHQVLPYSAKLTAEGFLYFEQTAHLVRGAILHYWLTFGDAMPVPVGDSQLADRIWHSVNVFGLPLSDEIVRTADNTIVQHFEQADISHDPAMPRAWQTRTTRRNP